MRKCEVYVHGKFAGILEESVNPKGYVFNYDNNYVSENSEPICLAMPVRKDPYMSDVLFPYFFNMLSEGENRAMQSAMLHLDKEDDFGILLETAQIDTVGAVTVKPII